LEIIALIFVSGLIFLDVFMFEYVDIKFLENYDFISLKFKFKFLIISLFLAFGGILLPKKEGESKKIAFILFIPNILIIIFYLFLFFRSPASSLSNFQIYHRIFMDSEF